MGYFTRKYRKVFGHKSPYRRVYGSRSAGQAIGTTYRTFKREGITPSGLARELAKVKRSLNVEKKHKDTNPIAFVGLGQVFNDADGAQVHDITPAIPQGTDGDERTGNSCKLTGFALKYQMVGQQHCRTKRRVQIMLVKARDAWADGGTSPSSILPALFDENPLTGVRDLNAPRNYSSMKHHGLSVLRTKTVYLGAQDVAVTTTSADAAHCTGSFTAAMQDVLRFDGSADNSPQHVKYFIVLRTDVGNSGASASTLPVPVTAQDSGVTFRSTLRTWWVDN